MEAWPRRGGVIAAQNGAAAQRNATGWSARVRNKLSRTVVDQLARLLEGGRIPEPIGSLYAAADINLTNSKFLALPRNIDVIATCSGGRTRWATEGNGLAALKRENPVNAPSANNGICQAARVMHEFLVFPERQHIAAADVEDIPNIEVGQAPIEPRTEARDVGCAVIRSYYRHSEVAGIGKRLRTRCR